MTTSNGDVEPSNVVFDSAEGQVVAAGLTSPGSPPVGGSQEVEPAASDKEDVAWVISRRIARNWLCAVNTLPVEILGMVFQFLCSMNSTAGLIVCAVCTYWRYTALGNPWLWRVIDFTAIDTEMADEFVRRSGRLPLTLSLGEKTHMDACRSAVFRTTALHLNHVKRYAHPLDKNSPFNITWPKVEALVLCSPVSLPTSNSFFPISSEHIFPLLQTLEMSCSYINAPFVSSNLRILRITNDIPAPEYVISLLHQCPRLEVIELSDHPSPLFFRIRTSSGAEKSFKRLLRKKHIAIPTLRHLTLRLPVSIIVDFLSCIKMPAEVEHLDILAYRSSRSRGIVSTANALLSSRCLPNSTFDNLDELRLYTRATPRDRDKSFSHIVYDRSSRSYHIEVGTDHPYCGSEEWQKLFGTVTQKLEKKKGLSSIRKLRIDDAYKEGCTCADSNPGRLIRRTPALELLEIRHHRVQDLYCLFKAWEPFKLPQLCAVVLQTSCENEQEILYRLLPVMARLSVNPVKKLQLELTCLRISSPERAKALFAVLKGVCAGIPEVYSTPTAVTFTMGASKLRRGFRHYHPRDLWPEDEPFTWKEGKMPDCW